MPCRFYNQCSVRDQHATPRGSTKLVNGLVDFMATVTAFEAKTRFGELLARVAKGEEIVITKYEKPVARIVPEKDVILERNRKALLALRELKESLKRQGMKPLTDAEIRSAINEGRR